MHDWPSVKCILCFYVMALIFSDRLLSLVLCFVFFFSHVDPIWARLVQLHIELSVHHLHHSFWTSKEESFYKLCFNFDMSDIINTQRNRVTYSRTDLLLLGPLLVSQCINRKNDSMKSISKLGISKLCGLPGCCMRRKRGRRGGVRQNISSRKHWTALPTVLFGNVESIKNKIDELAALTRYDNLYRNSCALMLTETWLNPDVPDECVSITGFTLIRRDRTSESGKERGGGVCVFLNNQWCTNFIVKHSSCTRDVEMLCVQCRPFYLPREFCCVYLIVVYIPPCANKDAASDAISSVVREMEQAKPDSAVIIAGDFNRASLADSLPAYTQYVDFVTYLDFSCLDLCYCNMKNAYRSLRFPSIGHSKHSMIGLLPTYVRKLEALKPVKKSFRQWTKDAEEQLRGCFECTDWSVFEEPCQDLDSSVETITDYINFCVDCVVPVKTIKIFPNNRPWVTKEVICKAKAKRQAWKTGDQAAKRRAKEDLCNTIDQCKKRYKEKVEACFERNDSKSAWMGLSYITGYKKKDAPSFNADETEWAEELNNFYCRFEKHDDDPVLPTDLVASCSLQEDDVRKAFQGMKANKAQGPDGISPRLLKSCAQELSLVFTPLFNRSLQECKVPKLWKTSIIVPVAKKPTAKELNDYRPVALTSCVMKSMERLVLKNLLLQVNEQMDPLQFAYKEKRGVEDACSLLIHSVAQHLDKPKNYARILFVDFSSAFNTMRPSVLIQKLRYMGVHPSLCWWLLSYLRQRPQRVRVNSTLSNYRQTSIGAPQGCVLSPVLFTVYTDDHRGTNENFMIVKYADDTALIGLLHKGMDDDYHRAIAQFVNQCTADDLQLNVSKTKEMIVDMRKSSELHLPVSIQSKLVEQVSDYKYLGVTVQSDLKWNLHIERQVKKATQRLYFLRKLSEFKVDRRIRELFYKSTIESVLLFGVVVWGSCCTQRDARKIQRIQRAASKTIGSELEAWIEISRTRVVQKAKKISIDTNHPLHHYYQLLPSMRRYRQLNLRTNRFKFTFVPNSISLLNS